MEYEGDIISFPGLNQLIRGKIKEKRKICEISSEFKKIVTHDGDSNTNHHESTRNSPQEF